jgi:hypothetical protein
VLSTHPIQEVSDLLVILGAPENATGVWAPTPVPIVVPGLAGIVAT